MRLSSHPHILLTTSFCFSPICSSQQYLIKGTNFEVSYAANCSTFGERRIAYRVLVGKPKERSHLEESGVDEKIILKRILWRWGGRMDWMDQAENRDRFWAAVNAVMKLGVPYTWGGGGIFWVAEDLLASLEGLCLMELFGMLQLFAIGQ